MFPFSNFLSFLKEGLFLRYFDKLKLDVALGFLSKVTGISTSAPVILLHDKIWII